MVPMWKKEKRSLSPKVISHVNMHFRSVVDLSGKGEMKLLETNIAVPHHYPRNTKP